MGVTNDIVFLWSHPRSVSSAMERIMHERGDLNTFHEPFLYLYYVHNARKDLAYFDVDPEHPTSYADIKEMILDAAELGPVFVKDMCYYVASYILDDVDFVKRIKSTFLIRDPKKAIASYYKLDQDLTCEEVGLESQYRQFERTAEITGEVPIVVDAEDLIADTEHLIRSYCGALGVPHLPHALNWSGDIPANWRYVAGWHTDLSVSNGIKQPSQDSVDLDCVPRLRQLYDHHLPYYQKMRQHRLKP